MNDRHVHLKKPNTRVNNSQSYNVRSYAKELHTQIPKYKSVNSTLGNGGNTQRSRTDRFSSLRSNLGGAQHRPQYAMEGCDLDRVPDEEEAGLSLELEIDDSIKNLLRQGSLDKLGKNYNKSLDVTFIQQAASPSPLQATVSLGMNEVSQLIEMVHAKGKKTSSKIDKLCNSSVEPELLDYYTTDYATDCSENLNVKKIVPPRSQQVYTTPQQTFKQIRSKLPCLSHSQTGDENFEKPGAPCLCRHCGMVGVLVESQKRPLIPHCPNPNCSGSPDRNSRETPQSQNFSRIRKKIIDSRTKSKSETYLILLHDLTSKIASLEDRLKEHEETTVKKDYFKFVIHKLLTQYSNKINELRNPTCHANKQHVNIATQYSKKQGYEGHNDRHERSERSERSERKERPEKDSSRYYPIKISTNHANPKSSTEEISSDRYYKKVHRSKVPKKTTNTSFNRNVLPKGGTHVGTNVKTFMANDQFSSPFDAEQNSRPNVQDNYSAHAIKNLCDIVYNKYCDVGKLADGRDRDKMDPEKLMIPSGLNAGHTTKSTRMSSPDEGQPNSPFAGCAGRVQNARNRSNSPPQSAKRMDAEYVSPAPETWQDESEQEFAAAKNTREHEQKREEQHLQYQRNNSGRGGSNANDAKNKTKHSAEDKIKYLKYLAKRKDVDESELWSNILNQARRHIRSNEDTVLIQLPSLVRGPEMSELELTLSKLKDIAKKSRSQRCKMSNVDLNYCSSSERLNPFLAGPERKRNLAPLTSNIPEEESRRHFIAR